MSWTSGPNTGNNIFEGDGAGNLADGQAGHDTLHGADGNATLIGGLGNDSVVGDIGAEDAPGRDSLLGGDGHETLSGGLEAGTLIAGAGDDSIHKPTHVSGHDSIDLGTLFGVGGPWTSGTDAAGATTYSYNPDGGAAEVTLYARSVNSVLCYAAGTRIATPRGEVPIEALRVGDLVTCAGPDASVQPILWIGRIEAQLAGHPQPERAWPVLIRAGALGAGRPRRDLRVSPDHGVFLEGALVPAKLLIDGVTILQERWWTAITYLHLELPEHAILLAEGLAAESWLDDGRRDEFDNAGLAAQFVDFGLELAAERPPGNFAVILDPAAAARLRDRAAPPRHAPALPAGLTWAAHRATKFAKDTKDTRHAPPPVRWRQRRHPDRAEA